MELNPAFIGGTFSLYIAGLSVTLFHRSDLKQGRFLPLESSRDVGRQRGILVNDTDVQVDPANGIDHLNSMSLSEPIIEIGIDDAIDQKLNKKGPLCKNAVTKAI